MLHFELQKCARTAERYPYDLPEDPETFLGLMKSRGGCGVSEKPVLQAIHLQCNFSNFTVWYIQVCSTHFPTHFIKRVSRRQAFTSHSQAIPSHWLPEKTKHDYWEWKAKDNRSTLPSPVRIQISVRNLLIELLPHNLWTQ